MFNLLFRHQIYLEGVKGYLAEQYTPVLTQVYERVQMYLAQYRYSTLDQFKVGELNSLLLQLQRAQQHIYSSYTEKLVSLLNDFLAADVDVTNAIYDDVANLPEDGFVNSQEPKPLFGASAADGTKESNHKLWKQIIADSIPANGLLLLPAIDKFAANATGVVLAAVRRGYANSWTVQQLNSVLVGTRAKRFSDGIFNRLTLQNQALVGLAAQHVSSEAQAGIASILYSLYQWCSILDSHTTQICIDRNGKIYVYGKGPLPPAWYSCRSKVVTLVGNDDVPKPKTFYQFIKQQNAEFQDEVLGASKAEALRNGTMGAEEFRSLGQIKALSIADFVRKIKSILGE